MDTTGLTKKKRFFLLLLLALLAAAIGGAYYVSGQRARESAARLDVLETQLKSLEDTTALHENRIKTLEDAPRKQGGTPPPGTTPLAAAPSPPPSEDRIAALEKEIAALKAASPGDSGRIIQSIRLLSAFHRLSDKVIGGKPFAVELATFEEAAGPDESTALPAALAPYADSGIPTFATLLATFDQAADSLNAAQGVPPANAGFWERFKYNLAHLITVRRLDDAQTGSSVDAIVGRAQAHLEREEIEAAAAEIKSLPDSARGNFSAWLDDAETVTQAPSLVDQMEEQVMQKAFHPPAPLSAPAPAPAAPAPPPAPPAETPSPSPKDQE